MPTLRKAEEVFLIVRELSRSQIGCFRWKLWYDACKAVFDPSEHQLKGGFKMTVGSMLRAQVRQGTVRRHSRGKYIISLSDTARHPLYVDPGQFRMRVEDLGRPRLFGSGAR